MITLRQVVSASLQRRRPSVSSGLISRRRTSTTWRTSRPRTSISSTPTSTSPSYRTAATRRTRGTTQRTRGVIRTQGATSPPRPRSSYKSARTPQRSGSHTTCRSLRQGHRGKFRGVRSDMVKLQQWWYFPICLSDDVSRRFLVVSSTSVRIFWNTNMLSSDPSFQTFA